MDTPRAEPRTHGRLADGMAIGARIRARLFGLRALQLDADVTVTPVRPYVRARVARPGTRREAPRGLSATNGSVGGGLDDAARSLEATIAELDEARRRIPEGPAV